MSPSRLAHSKEVFSRQPIWSSGTAKSGGDGIARFIDFDHDGDLDFVTSAPSPKRWVLYRNQDGKIAKKPFWESRETTDCDHIDGVTVKSCAFAVTMGPGYVEKENMDAPHYKPGRFADGTTVKNIHAIFGTNAAISLKGLANVPKEYLKELRFDKNDRKVKRVRGPSVGVVLNRTAGSWNPIIENVTSEGFKYNKGILKIDEKQPRNWRELLEGLPILEEFPQNKRKRVESIRNKRTSL